jgi:hypothetical protein
VLEDVLPMAMYAGGFNNSVEQGKAFFAAYATAWDKLYQEALKSVPPAPSVEQAQPAIEQTQPAQQSITGMTLEEVRAAETMSPVELTDADLQGVVVEDAMAKPKRKTRKKPL